MFSSFTTKMALANPASLWVRLFRRIQKRICDLRSYGFFTTKKTEDPKKDHLQDNGMSTCSSWEKKQQQQTDPHGEDKKKK